MFLWEWIDVRSALMRDVYTNDIVPVEVAAVGREVVTNFG